MRSARQITLWRKPKVHDRFMNVRLPKELLARVREAAVRVKRPVGELVREVLAAAFPAQPRKDKKRGNKASAARAN